MGLYIAKENNDILGLMINNLGETKQFYKLTKNQAENAYKLAKNSSIAGIALIVVAVIIALIFNNHCRQLKKSDEIAKICRHSK